eukprot:2219794-Prymnesium_polylepis.1
MESGLKVVDTAMGRGRAAKSGDKLSVRYSGLTADAKGNWFQVCVHEGGEGGVLRCVEAAAARGVRGIL